jgi:hypothetical protein
MKRKRRAPPGNQNAFKHGFYSSPFRHQELHALSQSSVLELADEIALMRVATARLLASLPQTPSLVTCKLSFPSSVLWISVPYPSTHLSGRGSCSHAAPGTCRLNWKHPTTAPTRLPIRGLTGNSGHPPPDLFLFYFAG